MKVFVKGQGPVTLPPDSFVSQGGQGRVYAQGDVAFKLYHDPATVISAGKRAELNTIVDPAVITPQAWVLEPARGHAIGYTMRFIRDAFVLGQLFPRAFREREGLNTDRSLALVERLRERIQSVHRAGVLLVDLNEMNFLADRSLREIYAIDCDSYQTPSYPADAIAPNIADPLVQAGAYSQESDWFSFAILAFQMLIGVHPFKGKHPTVLGLEARMRARLSVLNPEVVVPKSAYALSSIPESYRAYFHALFEEGQRLPPPSHITPLVGQTAPTRTMSSGQTVKITELFRLPSPIVRLHNNDGPVLASTQDALYMDGRAAGKLPEPRAAVVTTQKMEHPVAAWLNDEGALRLFLPRPQLALQSDLRGSQLVSSDGRLYLRCSDQILEVLLHDVGSHVIASSRTVTRVAPHATRLYPGVAVQNLLGATYVSLLSGSGFAYQLRLPELDGLTLVDAKYERGVLMALVHQQGSYHRYVIRFDADHRRYDLRVVPDVANTDLNFITLDNKRCVCLDEDERIEVFSTKIDAHAHRKIQDETIGGDMRLARNGNRVMFAASQSVKKLSTRSARPLKTVEQIAH